MKFAAIIPPVGDGLRILERVGLGYHLVLAQELLRNKEYREYYRILGRLGHFIICDNGAAEHETPPFEEVVKVAKYIGASEIVMPDVVLDKQGTLDALLQSRVLDLVPPRMRFIVPQGRTAEEWRQCHIVMHRELDSRYATIGLSKYHHVPYGPGGRAQLLSLLPQWIRANTNIHILGIATSDPFEEVAQLSAAAAASIRGIDTAAPIAYAQRVRPLPDPASTGEHISVSWDAPFDLDLGRSNVLAFAKHVSRL